MSIEPHSREKSEQIPIRSKVVLLLVFLLVLLNYGFMQIRVASIPLAEIVLLLFLITANLPLLLQRFSYAVNSMPFFAWWIYGIASAFWYLNLNGVWALRDASNILESLYILVGFSVFCNSSVRNLVINGYPKIIFVLCVYALTYPLSQHLREFSPVLVAGAGHSIPLLFNYTNSSLLIMLSVLYVAMSKSKSGVVSKNASVVSAFLIVFSIGFFQSRILYIHIIAIFLMLLFIKPSYSIRWIYIGFSVAILLLGISVSGIEIEGRLGQKLSLDFIQNHFMAIFGQESDGLDGAARGVDQRFGWWTDIFHRWSSDIMTMLFGLGYGFPLITFGVDHGVLVREPHNSYLSVVARGGIIGFLLWSWLHWYLLKSWYLTYQACKKYDWKEGMGFLLIVLGYFILIWLRSLVQDGFEKPFIAVSYYFLWGLVLRMYWYSKYNKISKNGIS